MAQRLPILFSLLIAVSAATAQTTPPPSITTVIRQVEGGVEIAFEIPVESREARLYWTDRASSQSLAGPFPAYDRVVTLSGRGNYHRTVLPVASGAGAAGTEPPVEPLPLGRVIHVRAACTIDAGGQTRELRSADRQLRLIAGPEGGPQRALVFTEEPAVTQVGAEIAVLRWETNEPARTLLHYWREDKPETKWSLRNEQPLRLVQTSLAGLESNRTYCFTVTSRSEDERDAIQAPPGTFRTAPDGYEEFRFAVMGNSAGDPSRGDPDTDVAGVNVKTLHRLATAAARRDARFILFTGDAITSRAPAALVAGRRYTSWRQALRPVRAHIPVYGTIGNGEATSPHRRVNDEVPGMLFAEDVWRGEQTLPPNGPPPRVNQPPYLENVYSFDFAHCHFVSLNSNYRQLRGADPASPEFHTIDPRQQEWLEADLAANDEKMTFVFFSEPAWPTGGAPGGALDRVESNRNRVWQILDKSGATAIFSGYLGHYSRLGVDERIRPEATRRLWQVVCGRAGGPGRSKNESLSWADKLEGYSEKDHFALVEVRRREVEIVVFDSDETVIDRWTIAKPRR